MTKITPSPERKRLLLRNVGRGLGTPLEIAEATGISSGHVSTYLRAFLAEKLVTASPTRDRTRVRYTLTGLGRAEARRTG